MGLKIILAKKKKSDLTGVLAIQKIESDFKTQNELVFILMGSILILTLIRIIIYS